MPKEWQEKAEAEYRKYADKGRDAEPERIRFVTYTPRYGGCDWLSSWHSKDVRKGRRGCRRGRANTIDVTTTNVRELVSGLDRVAKDHKLVIDGRTDHRPEGLRWLQMDTSSDQEAEREVVR